MLAGPTVRASYIQTWPQKWQGAPKSQVKPAEVARRTDGSIRDRPGREGGGEERREAEGDKGRSERVGGKKVGQRFGLRFDPPRK